MTRRLQKRQQARSLRRHAAKAMFDVPVPPPTPPPLLLPEAPALAGVLPPPMAPPPTPSPTDWLLDEAHKCIADVVALLAAADRILSMRGLRDGLREGLHEGLRDV